MPVPGRSKVLETKSGCAVCHSPNIALDGRTWPQHRPHMGQQSPSSAPTYLQNSPNFDRTWADVVPTELHVAPTWTQHGPTWIQHSSKVNTAPTWSHDSCWQMQWGPRAPRFEPKRCSRPVASAPRIIFYKPRETSTFLQVLLLLTETTNNLKQQQLFSASVGSNMSDTRKHRANALWQHSWPFATEAKAAQRHHRSL